MVYLKEQYLLDRKGNEVILQKDNEEFVPTMSYILAYIANGYSPSGSLTLSVGEIRHLNKALDVLEEKGGTIDEIMDVEDEHFMVLKKVIYDMLPRILIQPILRNSPQIEDFLEVIDTTSPQKSSVHSHSPLM